MSRPTRLHRLPQWSVLGRVRVPRKGGRFGFHRVVRPARHFVDFIKTWGGTWEMLKETTGWIWSHSAQSGHDGCRELRLRDSQLNPLSLIDYFILNGYIVSQTGSIGTRHGGGRHPDGDAKRWRYALWDMDAGFGHYINYTGVPDTGPGADPCNPDDMGNVGGQGHIPVLNALFENETFNNTT